MLYADVMPAVQTPSMTPDIKNASGHPIQLSMRELAALSDDGQTGGWQTLVNVAAEYNSWIQAKRGELDGLPARLRLVAERHLLAATACLDRINGGIHLLRTDDRARKAFRLAKIYVQDNADMKVQFSDDTTISTYNPIKYAYVGLRATRIPGSGDSSTIELVAFCKGMEDRGYFFSLCAQRIAPIYEGFKSYIETRL